MAATVTDETVVRPIQRRLLDARLPATWSIAEVAQAQSLQWWGAARFGGDAALLVDDQPPADARGHQAAQRVRRLRTRLDQIRASGISAAALHVAGDVAKTVNPQSLGPAAVQAIITDGGGALRSLPLGMWQFAPRAVAPSTERWLMLFRRKIQWMPPAGGDAPSVVAIDLQRMAAGRARALRECEALVGSVAEAQTQGAVAVVALAELASQLSSAHAVKPQRSILRAA
jgi:hypothetical protein